MEGSEGTRLQNPINFGLPGIENQLYLYSNGLIMDSSLL